ncbi:prolyl oligopeptidase family serine peptidase [Sphingopyxis panaciterrae]
MRAYKGFTLGLLGAVAVSAAAQAQDSPGLGHPGDEAYDWLDKADDPAARKWAEERTKKALTELLALPGAKDIEREIRDIAASTPSPAAFAQPYSVLGDTLARFVTNSEHPAGLIQTAPRGAAGAAGPWRTVLDIDALNAREGKKFGMTVLNLTTSCLPPEYRRCLIPLGVGGSEIQDVREFDLQTGQFLDEGFRFATAKTEMTWIDRDTLLIGQAIKGEKLGSGWPAKVRLWKRGTPYSDAPVVLSATSKDVFFRLSGVGLAARRKGIVAVAHDFQHYETFMVDRDGKLTATDLPQEVSYPGNIGLSGGTDRYIIGATTEPVTFKGKSYPEGSVFAYDSYDETPPEDRLQHVYSAPEGTYFYDSQFGMTVSKSNIYMVAAKNLARSLLVATPGPAGWSVKTLLTAPAGEAIDLWGGGLGSDTIVVGQQGYLKPQTLSLVEGDRCCAQLQANPSLFDASRFLVEIRTAKAKDGTLVDYFLVRPRDAGPGPVPTILNAYGGGGGAVSPPYAGKLLDGGLVPWLNRGGAYAYAAMRGGGEKGQAWYVGGIRRNKPKGLDDVAAVAEDMIGAGFTTPAKLGLTGRSFGGLMASAVAMRHPGLFAAVLPGVPDTDLFPISGDPGLGMNMESEYGDLRDPEDRAVILSYSPMQNIRAGVKYPRILTVASTSDDRVSPGAARRFTAKLEMVGAKPLLIEGPTGGHIFPKAATNPEAVTAEVLFFIDALMR